MDNAIPPNIGQDGQVTQATTIRPPGGSPDMMELDDLHNGEMHPEGLSNDQDIEVDRHPEHSDLGSYEACVLDQFPEVSEDTLADVDLILKDCQDLPVLKHFVAAFDGRFQRTGKTDDLDRKVHALREILQLTPEQGLTETVEDHYDMLLFDALAERCSATNCTEDKRVLGRPKRKFEDDGLAGGSRKRQIEDVQLPDNSKLTTEDEVSTLDQLPQVSEDTLSDIDLILEDCQDLPILKHYVAAFEDRFQRTGKKDYLDRKIHALQGILLLTSEQSITDTDNNPYDALLSKSVLERSKSPPIFSSAMDAIRSGIREVEDMQFREYLDSMPHDEFGILDQFPEVSEDTLSDVDLVLEECQDLVVLKHYLIAFTLRFSRDQKMEDLDRRIHALRTILLIALPNTTDEYFCERQLLFALCARHHITRAMDDGDKIGVVARRMLGRDSYDILALPILRAVLQDQAKLFQEQTSISVVQTNSLREIACLEEILDRFLREDSPTRWTILLRLSFVQAMAMLRGVRGDSGSLDLTILNLLKRSFEELWKTRHLIDERIAGSRSSIRDKVLIINQLLYLGTQGFEYLERWKEIGLYFGASRASPAGVLDDYVALQMRSLAFLSRHLTSNNLSDLRSSARCLEFVDTNPILELRIANSIYHHSGGRDDAERCKGCAQSLLKRLEKDEFLLEGYGVYPIRKVALDAVVDGLLNHFRSDCLRNTASLRNAAKLVFSKELMDGTERNWERLAQLGNACFLLFERTWYMPTVHFGIAFLRLGIEGFRAAGGESLSRALFHTQALANALFKRHMYLLGWMNSGLPLTGTENLNEGLLVAILQYAPMREVDIFQSRYHCLRHGQGMQVPGLEELLALIFFKMEGHTNFIRNEEEEWFCLAKAAAESYRDPSLGLSNSPHRLSTLMMYAVFSMSSRRHEDLRHPVIPVLREAISVLQLYFISQPSMHSQCNFMRSENVNWSQFVSVPISAAHYAVVVGDIRSAVEFLEYGRSLIWSRMRGLRTAEMELQGVNEDLRGRFAQICEELEEIVTVETQLDPLNASGIMVSGNVCSTIADTGITGLPVVEELPGQPSDIIERKRRLDEELEMVVEKIRETPGYEDFLQMTPFHKLQSAAREGPIIILTMCTESLKLSGYDLAHAMIVLDSQEPIVVSLSEGANLKCTLTRINGHLREIRRRPGESGDRLMTVLKDIGEHFVKEVAATLLSLGVMEHSRIWWCLTSDFSNLPIHAAMWQDQAEHGRTKFTCLSDIYISSYTPSLSALIHARSPQITSTIGNETAADDTDAISRTSMLIVKQQDQQLASADQEVKNIESAAWMAGHTSDSLHVYAGEAEDERQKVLYDLRHSEWIHFACHGILNDTDPFSSHFQVGSGKITLRDILKSKVPNAELAFLSACHSAGLPEDIAKDESLHLAAAMQFCGFRSVVGTMWPLNDEDGPRVAKAFYEYMFAKPKEGEEAGHKRSARALNRVIQRMRRHPDYKQAPERWVNFVHIGA